MSFFLVNVDLNQVTLELKLDLDMVKMYLYTQNKVPSSSHSQVVTWTDRQTDRQTYRQIDRPH